MATLILEEIKESLGVNPDNLGFDSELLGDINSAKANLIQLGVTDLDIDINEETSWPVMVTKALTALTKAYLVQKTKQMFDPTASETIAKTLASNLEVLEGRIAYEIEEIG